MEIIYGGIIMRIFIVRHGESYSNVQGRIMSTTDLPLTEKGIKQAETAKIYIQKILCSSSFNQVFSSPLLRAKQTAAIICGNEKSINISDGLSEMNLGKLEGLTWEERIALYPEINLENSLSKAMLPEGETFEDVFLRCKRFIQNNIKRKSLNENILIVSHGITIRIFINCLLGKPKHCVNFLNWSDNTAISEIDWQLHSNSKTLIRLNDRTHLMNPYLGTLSYETWGSFSTYEYSTAK